MYLAAENLRIKEDEAIETMEHIEELKKLEPPPPIIKEVETVSGFANRITVLIVYLFVAYKSVIFEPDATLYTADE